MGKPWPSFPSAADIFISLNCCFLEIKELHTSELVISSFVLGRGRPSASVGVLRVGKGGSSGQFSAALRGLCFAGDRIRADCKAHSVLPLTGAGSWPISLGGFTLFIYFVVPKHSVVLEMADSLSCFCEQSSWAFSSLCQLTSADLGKFQIKSWKKADILERV